MEVGEIAKVARYVGQKGREQVRKRTRLSPETEHLNRYTRGTFTELNY